MIQNQEHFVYSNLEMNNALAEESKIRNIPAVTTV